ncbi:MAG TPA: hypothetical protein ENJ09_00455 [Planctomycetes bacterium]|nr:hypothetical protein [Planctomycetota bacterium]
MKLFRLLFALLFLIVLIAVGLWYGSDSLARKAITTGGTSVLGVETKLDKVSIGWFSGELSLSGLEVANPEGFSNKPFFRMEEAEFAVDLPTLLADQVVASLLSLEGIRLSLEAKGTKTNYDALLEGLDSGSSGGGGGKGKDKGGADKSSSSGGSEKTYKIERIVLDDIQISLDLGSPLVSGGGTIDLPKIELDNLSSEGMTARELTALILRTLVEHAAASGQDFFPNDLLDRVRASVNGFADIQGIGEIESLDDVRELRDNLENAGEEAKSAIRGLLGKD